MNTLFGGLSSRAPKRSSKGKLSVYRLVAATCMLHGERIRKHLVPRKTWETNKLQAAGAHTIAAGEVPALLLNMHQNQW